MQANLLEAPGAARARIVLLDTGERMPPHGPPSRYGIRMLVGGAATYLCDCASSLPKLRVALPGDVAVASSSDHFHPASAPRALLSVDVSDDILAEQAAALGIDPAEVRIEPTHHARDPELQRIGWEIRDALSRDGAIAAPRLAELSAAAARRLLERYSNRSRGDGRRFSRAQMRKLRLFIDENIDRRLDITRLARYIGTSPTNFKILFHNAAGVSAHRYVVERRVSYAMSLIRSGDAPLSEIALQAGFFDQSHMTRCMRRVLGVTPSALRAGGGGELTA